jgi:hypothetical protein
MPADLPGDPARWNGLRQSTAGPARVVLERTMGCWKWECGCVFQRSSECTDMTNDIGKLTMAAQLWSWQSSPVLTIMTRVSWHQTKSRPLRPQRGRPTPHLTCKHLQRRCRQRWREFLLSTCRKTTSVPTLFFENFQSSSTSSGLKVLMSPIVSMLDSHQIRRFQ